MTSAAYWIKTLKLIPHVEGGFFRESHRGTEILHASSLPIRYDGPRALTSSIYFLLEAPSVSHLHRLNSDEIWLFHTGGPLTLHIIDPRGDYTQTVLGLDPERGQQLHAVVERGSWFGATVADSGGFALVSCFVAPAFEFSDFELADRPTMIDRFPQHSRIIEMLTPP